MIFWTAFLICSAGIAGLFWLDRDPSTHNSKAFWLPVIWLWIAGSRPVSDWFGVGGSGPELASTLDGSPLDAAIFQALIVTGIIVVLRRRDRAIPLIKAIGPVLVYLLYCLMSVAWSPFPEPAFKRWIKYLGDLVMVLVVLTDGQPMAALRRLFSRVGFLLFPASILMIRYTDLGRAFDPDGMPMNTGVTTNKNSLGLIVYLVSLGALWNVCALLSDRLAPNRSRRLVAQGTLLAFGAVLLQMAHCATAVFCALLGGGLLLATRLRAFRNRPTRVHALCLGIVLVGGIALFFGGESTVTGALGRKDNLGRTDIWAASIASADNPVIGTGFESFWNANAGRVARSPFLAKYFDMSNLVSAHNGYIEVYLDLGWVGVCLIAIILVSGYRNACKAFESDPVLGSLILAYVATGMFYSITETGFRLLTPSWILLLLAIVGASGAVGGFVRDRVPKSVSSRVTVPTKAAASNNLLPARESVYAGRARIRPV